MKIFWLLGHENLGWQRFSDLIFFSHPFSSLCFSNDFCNSCPTTPTNNLYWTTWKKKWFCSNLHTLHYIYYLLGKSAILSYSQKLCLYSVLGHFLGTRHVLGNKMNMALSYSFHLGNNILQTRAACILIESSRFPRLPTLLYASYHNFTHIAKYLCR